MDELYELEPLEQLKVAYKILDNVGEYIHYNAENENDIKTINTIITICLQLKEIIKEYDTNAN
jgi:hypothetical protein